jgi:uncharacterized protein DUF6916
MTDPLQKLTAKVLSEHLHTNFRVHRDKHGPVDLEIVEVTEPSSPPQLESFVLVLRGPKTPFLEQRTHHLEHEKLGAFDIFITAIAADAQSTTYEVIFNRFRQQRS